MAVDAAVLEAPKAIAKAGLSEYFIYSIEGTRDGAERLGEASAQLCC